MTTKNSTTCTCAIRVGPCGQNDIDDKKWNKIFSKKKTKIYLAGAIEFAPDGGNNWRKTLTSTLTSLGYEVINPHFTPLSYTKDQLEKYREEVRKKVIFPDLKLIDDCDVIIVNWDEYTKYGGGTHGELTYALVNKIPVYLIENIPRSEISGWILACTTQTFKSFKKLEDYLNSHGENKKYSM